MRYIAVGLAAAMLLLTSAGAQETMASKATSETVFAPFPSKLRMALRENTVALTWEDSTDTAGKYAIFRSTSPFINASALTTATRIGTVNAGVGTYVDKPPRGAYYYLVLAVDEKGEPYKVFIPSRNTNIAPVTVEAANVTPTTAVSGASSSIQGIRASLRNDAIVIAYKTQEKGKRLVLYRGNAPIYTTESLLEAVLVTSFEDKDESIVDYPIPGIDYWYALFIEDDLRSGRMVLEAGNNSTRESIKIPAGVYRVGLPETSPLSRTPPLPSFLLDRSIVVPNGDSNSVMSQPYQRRDSSELEPETIKAIAVLLRNTVEVTPVAPALRLLPDEMSNPSGGEDYALALVVKGELMSGQWGKAVEQLRKYLSLNRSPRAVARASYYLGVALARQEEYREAFFQFLKARGSFSVETAPWLDYLTAVLRQSE